MATDQSVPAGAAPEATREPGRQRVRRARLAAILAALLLFVAVAATTVWGRWLPSEHDLMEDAGLIGKPELLVGVKSDQPGIGLLNATGQFEGFDIDIAHLIAADLGFRPSEVRFVAIESEDRERMQARDGDRFVTVDLVVASYSISEQREAHPRVSFSAPYLETEQSVLTRRDHGTVRSLQDLSGGAVCTISTSTSEAAAERAGTRPDVQNGIGDCIDGLRDGTYDAVTTDAAILAGFVHREAGLFTLHDIGQSESEVYGVSTGGNEALRTLVNLALYRSRNDPEDRRWEDAFDRHLRPEQKASGEQQVAVAEQPDVPKPEIREAPWDKLLILVPAVLAPCRPGRGFGHAAADGWPTATCSGA